MITPHCLPARRAVPDAGTQGVGGQVQTAPLWWAVQVPSGRYEVAGNPVRFATNLSWAGLGVSLPERATLGR